MGITATARLALVHLERLAELLHNSDESPLRRRLCKKQGIRYHRCMGRRGVCNIGKTTGVRVRSVLRLYAWPLELKRIRKRHRDRGGLDRISRRDRDLKRVLPPRNIGNAQSYTIEIRRDLWGGGVKSEKRNPRV